MKILFFSRLRVKHSAEDIAQIFECIERYNLDYGVNWEIAPTIEAILGREIAAQNIYTTVECETNTPSVMLCYGGDGTILEGAHRLCGAPIPIVGINSGRLGYLASTPKSDIDRLFETIVRGELKIEERTMLRVEGDFLGAGEALYAVNELTAQRFGATMISVELYLDGELVSTYHGDGAIVATPTGSTAYSLSAGGAVLAPTCSSFIITPLAPHNLTMRPIITPDQTNIELRVKSREGDIKISIDNRNYTVDSEAFIKITKSDKTLFLGSCDNNNFYSTLKEKLMWGIDPRL